MNKHILVVFSLLLSIAAFSQKRQVLFDRIGVAEGLPEGFITDIIQDSKGYIWIAGFEGLYRYDGVKAIPSDIGTNNTSLTTNRIFDIEEDKNQDLWIGTFIGLNRIERKSGRITRYLNIGNGKKVIPGNLVEHVFTDSDNDIWIDTDGGMALYDRSADSFINVVSTVPYFCRAIFEDKNKRLWIGTNNGLLSIDKDKKEIVIPADTSLASTLGRVYNITEDRNGNIWLCTATGLWIFDPTTFSASRPRNINSQYINMPCGNILHDSRNNYWVTSGDSLIVFTNDNTAPPVVYRKDETNPNSISAYVRVLFEDNNGNIWLGTGVGINKVNPAAASFRFYSLFPGQPYNSPYNHVQRVYQSSKGQMFYYTRTGVYTARSIGDSIREIKSPTTRNFLEQFYEMPDGSIWICYSAPGKGIWKYVPETSSMQQVITKSILDSVGIYYIQQDIDSNDQYWIASVRGLYKYNKRTGSIKHIELVRSINTPYPIIRVFLQSASGKIWLDAGIILISYDKKTGIVTEYPQQDKNSNSPGIRVRTIEEGADSTIWIALETGLTSYNEHSGKFTNYTTRNGLKGGNIVYSLKCDKNGSVWFNTFNYITSLNPATGKFRYFSEADGINTTFNRGSSCILNDGQIAFGGANGLITFHPDSMAENHNLPTVVFSKIEVNNQAYSKDTLPEYQQSIIMSYNDKVISFEFNALEYAPGSRNEYAYKMEGFDNDWTYSGTGNKATYTNLEPGTYRFLVKASNYQGFWGENVNSISVTVKPIYWQQWWFRSLIIFAALALLYYLWRSNKNRQKLKQEKELAIQNDRYKTRFLSNVSHEIRTPLNAIIGLNKLLLDTPLTSQQYKYAHAASQSSESLLTLINDLLDQAKIESGNFRFSNKPFRPAQVVQQVKDTFQHKAEEKGLLLEAITAPDIPANVAGDAVRLHQVLSNIVSNAIKFTEKGRVTLSATGTYLSDALAKITFRIEDTGIGINENKLDKIFESFHQEDNELQQSALGTGLGLSISRQLVEQQGGSITAESTPGKGSVFTITLTYKVVTTPDENLHEHKQNTTTLSALNILLVEDTPFNQLLAVEILKKNIPDVKVTVAENGREALDILNANQDFDIILMDVKMPVLNGYDTTKAIRAMTGKYFTTVPIIALTANAVPEQLQLCTDAGMNAWVTKPIDTAELLKAITDLINKKEQNG